MTGRASILCLAALAAASTAAAQGPEAIGTPRPGRWWTVLEAELRVNGSYIANFFQAPAELPGQNVIGGTGEVRVELPFAERRGRAFLRASGTVYDAFDPGAGLILGSRWSAGSHQLEASTGFRWRNPRAELGGEIGSADLYYAGGSYRIRPVRQLELSALADYYRATYAVSTFRNHHVFDAGGTVRYRGFGYEFMPEAGATFGRLDARLDAEDYGQRTFWIAGSSVPTPPVYVSGRYRNRRRHYATEDDTSSSFGREDTRHQLTLTASVELDARWSWLLYYSFEDARSTRASRTFTTQLLLTGLAYRID